MQNRRQDAAWRLDRPQESDWAAAARLERAANLSPWGEAAYRRAAAADGLALVARTADGEVCGFIIGHVAGDTLEVDNLAVAAGWRRRGIGTALMAALAAQARARGARRVTLEVRASNVAAQRFYERCGLQVVGRRGAYYREPVEDGLVMSGPLDGGQT